jgi:hypothetical protein
MAVKAKQYSMELEREIGKGKDLEQAHKTAAKKSEVEMAKQDETWIQKLKRKSHELLKGEKTYISKERLAEMKAANKTTEKKTNVLKDYANQTVAPQFQGARGSDLAELQKRFGKKK